MFEPSSPLSTPEPAGWPTLPFKIPVMLRRPPGASGIPSYSEAPAAMLAADLTALMIEGVAVAVVRRLAEHRDASVVFDVAKLAIVRDVAPDEIAPLAAPSRSFIPLTAGEKPMNPGVVDPKLVEGGVDRDDVGIWIRHRGVGTKIS